ncbi:hypothetical protein RvY_09578 [Ramazzottius varieornatus]|uniref:Uncharacterized protein n=1 Tax=Ramazzottius varieornatus TaxID=947166 RepID=A0A1D1V9T2_RAMVA|nr:hypothetical protein RvY_09578 [Ramazzottius varieornatus]
MQVQENAPEVVVSWSCDEDALMVHNDPWQITGCFFFPIKLKDFKHILLGSPGNLRRTVFQSKQDVKAASQESQWQVSGRCTRSTTVDEHGATEAESTWAFVPRGLHLDIFNHFDVFRLQRLVVNTQHSEQTIFEFLPFRDSKLDFESRVFKSWKSVQVLEEHSSPGRAFKSWKSGLKFQEKQKQNRTELFSLFCFWFTPTETGLPESWKFHDCILVFHHRFRENCARPSTLSVFLWRLTCESMNFRFATWLSWSTEM